MNRKEKMQVLQKEKDGKKIRVTFIELHKVKPLHIEYLYRGNCIFFE